MKKQIFTVFLLIFSVVVMATNDTIYVNDTAVNGSNNGTSWTDAYLSFQSALNAATSGDQIWVAQGTYKPSSDYGLGIGNRGKHFRMINGVAIYGGFAGTESAVSERTDFGHGGANETILSGDIGTPGTNSDNCYHVFYHPPGITSTAIMDGFTITGGHADGGGLSHNNGGGMMNDGISYPTITNITFLSNYAESGGGGMYNTTSSNPTLTNVLFLSNSANQSGGGMYNDDSDPTLTNATFSLNTAVNNGGGLYNINASPTLNNCIVWGNSAAAGKQIYMDGGTITLNYSCYANGTGDTTAVNSAIFTASNNNITTDPKFVDPAGDFRICGNSPCVNTGNNGYNSTVTDIRGQARIQNTTIDMGAYEWTSGTEPDVRIFYVDSSASAPNNGKSWATAFTSFQLGLNAADSSDQVWVAAGTYKPDTAYDLTNTPRYYHFRMIEGVEIYGGFAGMETAISQRTDFGVGGIHETILSGDITGDNCYHVFYHPSGLNLTSSAILDGFTIRDGYANGSDVDGHNRGGGMYNTSYNSPSITNVAFLSNYASLIGGGLYNSNHSDPTVTNAVFQWNSAVRGGGMYNIDSSSPTITNAVFSLNYASDKGGGMRNYNSSSPVINNATFSSNSAGSGGGGMGNDNSSPTLNNCIVWGNTAPAGRQLYMIGGTTTLNYSCYANGTGDVYGTPVTSNCTTKNPKYIDPAGDFRIYGNSPCVNTGNNSYNSETYDIRGEARIQNTTIDMGAWEWTSGMEPVSDTVYVDSIAGGSNNGSSWANAFTSFQSALDLAADGDQVWVAKGTYMPSYAYDLTNTSRYYHFRMIEGVAIYGGFAGTEIAINERTDFGVGGIHETILSGDITGDNCYHVFYHPSGLNLSSTAILDGFTITDANANGIEPHDFGGGMYNYISSPTITNTSFMSNSAVNVGGGMYNYVSSPIITNATFLSNSAGNGGCMFNYNNSSPTITNATFSLNSAVYSGGCMYNYSSSSLTLNNCIIWGNTATNDGNQFYVDGGTTTLNYSCYANGTGDVTISSGTFMATNNNLTMDPNFIDVAGGDLRIHGNSPCVDAGNNGYNSEAYDIRGEARIQDGTIDMGAYEWTSGTDPYGIFYVKHDAAGSDDGKSWANAFTSFQSALDISVTGDQVWVAAGTYKPSYAYDLTNTSRYYHFRMIEGVEIYGGFDGTETAVSQRTDFSMGGANETILNGDIGTPDDSTDNCYHIFYHPAGLNLTSTARLDGFTIKGGNADGSEPHFYGGGMYNYTSSPTITNTTFSLNSANNYGGGMFNHYYSSPTITNAVFTLNSALSLGGGMYNGTSSSPTIINTTFSLNSAPTGGGIRNFNSSPVINNCIVWGNNATTSGKQLAISGGTTTLNYTCYSNGINDVNGTPVTNNCITKNPKYIDPAGDFRIHGNSPCVNTGNNSYNGETYDIRGEARIQNTTIDMGAWEWTSGMEPVSDTVYVDSIATAGGNTGTNWANAFTSLQSALDLAAEGDQVWVAKGTYRPSYAYGLTNTSRYYHFRMINGVPIYGGFAGTETAVNQRTAFVIGGTNETILSGDLNGDDVVTGSGATLSITNNGENCYHVFYHPSGLNLTNSAILDGFTIRGGNANVNNPHDRAGGMYSNNSAPVITNVAFLSNSAKYGGGMWVYQNAPTISNVSFNSNFASIDGGGITNHGTTSQQTITNVLFQSNKASTYGGGMHNYQSSPTITNVLFWSNNSSLYGGGLSSYGHTSPTMTNVTFLENSAGMDGGGMYNGDHSSPTIINAVFSSNSAIYGGGMYNQDYSNPVVTNATFSLNNANTRGGGMYSRLSSSATFENCIVWGNTTTPGINGQQFCLDGGATIMNYSCFSDTIEDIYIMSGTFTHTNNNINVNPKFVDPDDDFRIYGNSPCVNTGNNGYNGETYDIRDETRIQNTTIDMGAYEWTSGIDPAGRIFYVDSSASSPNNGKSWTTAFTSFQSGLNAADSSDQVWVAAGTYKPSSTYDIPTPTDRHKHFRMIEGVEIYGGFAGSEDTLSQRTDFGVGGIHETILSGDLGIINDSTDNCYHVFYHPAGLNLTSSAILDGFTIEGGTANGSNPHYWGGGMYNDESSPSIINATFLSNYAHNNGGGMYNDNSSPAITNAVFSSNSSRIFGGGIYCKDGSSPIITNATFASNSATLGYGGGMYHDNASPTLNNCIVWGNTAAINGKQISIASGTTTLNYSCYANGANDVDGTTVINDCITTDPKFVDDVNGDFRIYGDSPCVNTGFDSYNPESIDIRGELRIQDGNIDRGAYEWTQGLDPAGTVIPVRYVENDTTANGDNDCFDATQTIFVSDFVVQSGGNVRFVAGNLIVFGVGTKVEENAYMLAEITEIGDYCTQPPSMLAVVPEGNEYVELPEQDAASLPHYKIYPNPTTGTFTLEMRECDQHQEVTVRIFALMGEMVLGLKMKGESSHIFDLSGQPDGLYLVRIFAENEMSVAKIIKQ